MSGFASGETMIHIGFALVGASYVAKSALTLRVLTIAAYLVFAAAVVLIQSPAMETLLAWYAVFIAIAGSRALWLVHERRLAFEGPDERRLHALALSALDVPHARRLMACGQWMTLPPGHVLTVEGHAAMRVFVLLDGHARVSVGGRPVALVGPGQFIGEIGLIAGRPACATVVAGRDDADGPLRVLAWRQEELADRMRREPAIHAAVLAALGPDLARKLAEQNSTGGRVPAQGEPASPSLSPAPAT